MKDLAEKLENDAGGLLDQGKFLEASAKLGLASKEWADSGDVRRAKLAQARGFFFEGLGTYLQVNFGGHFAKDDVKTALDSFEKAENAFKEIGEEKGVKANVGWEYFMRGILEDSSGRPDLAEQNYRNARAAFKEMRDFSDVVKQAQAAVETNLLSAMLGQVFLNPGSLKSKMRDAYSLIDELKEKNPESASFYKAQLLVYRALDSSFQRRTS